MHRRASTLRYLVAPLLTVGAILLTGSLVASIWGGGGSFRWMFVHGASGPLAGMLLYEGHLNAGDTLLAAMSLTCMAARVRYPNGWILALSLCAAVAWPLIGWAAGV